MERMFDGPYLDSIVAVASKQIMSVGLRASADTMVTFFEKSGEILTSKKIKTENRSRNSP